jgi:hypothetical protein
LEEVVTMLHHHITGNGGMNLRLTKWVDDLTAGTIQGEKTGKYYCLGQGGRKNCVLPASV